MGEKRQKTTMSIRNWIPTVPVVLMLAVSFGAGFAQSPAKEDTPQQVPENDYLQQMIELVVEANPSLQSQMNLIKEIEAVPEPANSLDLTVNLTTGVELENPDGGERSLAPIGSIELGLPLYSWAKKRKTALDKLITQKDLSKATQDYYHLKNTVVSDLLARVDKLGSLKNELDGQKNLLSLLQFNLDALKKQVEAGIASPSDLWAISERVMSTETKIATFLSKIDILKRETAVNLAGTRWPELLQMLDQVVSQTPAQE